MVDRRDGADPFAQLKDPDEQYKVYDSHYEKIGDVNDLVLGEDGRVLKRRADFGSQDRFRLRLADGEIGARVE
jgi:cobalamin biosynthesis protein CobT